MEFRGVVGSSIIIEVLVCSVVSTWNDILGRWFILSVVMSASAASDRGGTVDEDGGCCCCGCA